MTEIDLETIIKIIKVIFSLITAYVILPSIICWLLVNYIINSALKTSQAQKYKKFKSKLKTQKEAKNG